MQDRKSFANLQMSEKKLNCHHVYEKYFTQEFVICLFQISESAWNFL